MADGMHFVHRGQLRCPQNSGHIASVSSLAF
jgi:hypothetical protein